MQQRIGYLYLGLNLFLVLLHGEFFQTHKEFFIAAIATEDRAKTM